MVAKRLKGVILSTEDTLVNSGQIKADVYSEVKKLMNFFSLRGITPVLLSNRNWTVTDAHGNKRNFFDELEKQHKDLVIFSPQRDKQVPFKPSSAATQYVLEKNGLGTE